MWTQCESYNDTQSSEGAWKLFETFIDCSKNNDELIPRLRKQFLRCRFLHTHIYSRNVTPDISLFQTFLLLLRFEAFRRSRYSTITVFPLLYYYIFHIRSIVFSCHRCKRNSASVLYITQLCSRLEFLRLYITVSHTQVKDERVFVYYSCYC